MYVKQIISYLNTMVHNIIIRVNRRHTSEKVSNYIRRHYFRFRNIGNTYYIYDFRRAKQETGYKYINEFDWQIYSKYMMVLSFFYFRYLDHEL